MSLYEQIKKNYHIFSEKKTLSLWEDTRRNALSQFNKLGFPSKKDEEYKYTNLKEVIEKQYQILPQEKHSISKEKLKTLYLGEQDLDLVVVINGKLHPELCKISDKNIKVLALEDVLSNGEDETLFRPYFNTITNDNWALPNLNLVFVYFGVALYVPKNTVVEKPIHILYISQNQVENTFYNPRNILVVESGSQIEIVETHYNFDTTYTFTNSLTEIFTKPNSKANWHKLQNDTETSYLVDHTFVKQERNSLATVNTFSFGGKLVRNNLNFIQEGENINSFMNGITVIGKDQLVDHHTAVYHNQPNCKSYQNYKGIFKDNAHGVFNGKVFVDKIAQKTNAYQQNNNILLSEKATIDSKPQLEIFADDVKCSHGCTVGQLNEDALFYLRARGISKNEAQALLLYAFANDAMENIDIEPLKLKIAKLLAEKLEVNIEF